MENTNRNKLKELINSIVDVLTDEARAEAVEEHKKKEALGAVRNICIENERLRNCQGEKQMVDRTNVDKIKNKYLDLLEKKSDGEDIPEPEEYALNTILGLRHSDKGFIVKNFFSALELLLIAEDK